MTNLLYILIKYKTSYLTNLTSKSHPLLSAVSFKPLTSLERQSLSVLLNIAHHSTVHGRAGRNNSLLISLYFLTSLLQIKKLVIGNKARHQ
jgi:hypothetical protein